MPNQTAHGCMYLDTNVVFQSAEVNRSNDMLREDRAAFAKAIMGGIPMALTGLAVSVTGSGLQVQVATGEGLDGAGYPIYVPATKPTTAVAHGMAAEGVDPVITLDAAHATLPRIDLVCIRAATLLTDFSSIAVKQGDGSVINQVKAQTKLAYFQIVKVTGTAAASPVAPSAALSTDLVLAQVAVAAAATTLTSGNITDRRRMITPVTQAGTRKYADLATLAAVVGTIDSQAIVPGFGYYNFVPGATEPAADGKYIVNGVGGVWYLEAPSPALVLELAA